MLITKEEYLDLCFKIDEINLKRLCDFCKKDLELNEGNNQWKFYDRDRHNNILIIWKVPGDHFIFHPECAMNLAIELVVDAKMSKFGKTTNQLKNA
jgi:hypothetical protein